jgi:hypothetical protein
LTWAILCVKIGRHALANGEAVRTVIDAHGTLAGDVGIPLSYRASIADVAVGERNWAYTGKSGVAG